MSDGDGVEFLDPADPPPDDLTDHAEPDHAEPDHAEPDYAEPDSRRALVVRAALVLALLVGGGAWIASRPTSTSSPTQRAGAVVTKTVAPPSPTADAVVVECRRGTRLSDDILAAMHKFLPGIAVDNLGSHRCVRTAGGERRIVAESITGTWHGLSIAVQLRTRDVAVDSDGLTLSAAGDGAVPLGSIDVESAGSKVSVGVSGRSTDDPPIHRLQALADYLSLTVVL